MRSRFVRTSQSEERAGDALPGVRVGLLQLERTPVSLEALAMKSLGGKSVAGQNQSEDLVSTPRENARDFGLSAVVKALCN